MFSETLKKSKQKFSCKYWGFGIRKFGFSMTWARYKAWKKNWGKKYGGSFGLGSKSLGTHTEIWSWFGLPIPKPGFSRTLPLGAPLEYVASHVLILFWSLLCCHGTQSWIVIFFLVDKSAHDIIDWNEIENTFHFVYKVY